MLTLVSDSFFELSVNAKKVVQMEDESENESESENGKNLFFIQFFTGAQIVNSDLNFMKGMNVSMSQ